MSDKRDLSRNMILNANRQVHSALAKAGEYNKSPHFRQENQNKVKAILKKLTQELDGPTISALDLGCGTGFIIHLLVDLVDEIHGVDITDDMMKLIDLSSGKVFLKNAEAENTPFPGEKFSLVTAYSFLDHLESLNAQETLIRHGFLEAASVSTSGVNPQGSR